VNSTKAFCRRNIRNSKSGLETRGRTVTLTDPETSRPSYTIADIEFFVKKLARNSFSKRACGTQHVTLQLSRRFPDPRAEMKRCQMVQTTSSAFISFIGRTLKTKVGKGNPTVGKTRLTKTFIARWITETASDSFRLFRRTAGTTRTGKRRIF